MDGHLSLLAALFIATLIGNQDMVKPALVYSLYSFWTACIFAYTANKLNSGEIAELGSDEHPQ